ncbi:phosphatase [Atractiella rhizophila]|nr:phosphatase [Atractiella rhizophila]
MPGVEGPSLEYDFSGVLFDMDSTLLDSHPGLKGAWEEVISRFPAAGLDVEKVMSESQGVRTKDNFIKYFGFADPEQLQAEVERFELDIIRFASPPHGPGLVVIPGAAEAVKACSAGKWAVCTSGMSLSLSHLSSYATAALQTVGLPKPDAFVTADTVARGKPNPDPYLQGASSLSLLASSCLVVEDAPNGVRSGKAAGAKVLALVTSHTREQVKGAGADWVVDDLSKVKFEVADGRTRMRLL